MDHLPATLRQTEDERAFGGGLVEAEWRTTGVQVTIEFEREEAPLLQLGQQVELGLDLAGNTMQGHGRIHGRGDDERTVSYRVVLDREGTLQLGTVLNRREAVRVRPGDDDVLYLRLEWSDGGRDLLPVHDLSGLGLSVLVEDHLEARLLEVFELRFLLHLDGCEPLVIDGRVRNRVIEGSQVALGIEFDPERTPSFGKVQDEIYRWVAGRYQRQVVAPPRAS